MPENLYSIHLIVPTIQQIYYAKYYKFHLYTYIVIIKMIFIFFDNYKFNLLILTFQKARNVFLVSTKFYKEFRYVHWNNQIFRKCARNQENRQ